MAATYTDFVGGGSVGTGSIIYNSLQSPELSIVAISDPTRVTDIVATQVDAYTRSVASQINATRMAQNPPMEAVDLENYIVDIIIETTVQGASLLELHLIDPWWSLLARDPSTGRSFIDVDDSGYLWPPLDLNFPPSVSDATWRLAQCKPTTDLSGANLVLTFEDKIAAELREHSAVGTTAQPATDPSCAQSSPNETRAEFIKRCVNTASKNPQIADDSGIRFIPLLTPGDFSPSDLQSAQVQLPASAVQPNAPQGRAGAAGANKSAQVSEAARAAASIPTIVFPLSGTFKGVTATISQVVMGLGQVGGHDVTAGATISIGGGPQTTAPSGVPANSQLLPGQ